MRVRRKSAPPTKAQIDFLMSRGYEKTEVQRLNRARASELISKLLKVTYPQRIDLKDLDWEDSK